ncbi:hypothetical protein, partial [Nostoc sp. UHCC 0251]|uniref:hypothetical protein n=1 Tax=Nostoc sp. UHCC 0251 TaxID=3110240 RepID=UPI002B21C358
IFNRLCIYIMQLKCRLAYDSYSIACIDCLIRLLAIALPESDRSCLVAIAPYGCKESLRFLRSNCTGGTATRYE